MNQLSTRAGVRATQAHHRVTETMRKAWSDERGEIGSWLVLAAGLGVLAIAAMAAIGPWIQSYIDQIAGLPDAN